MVLALIFNLCLNHSWCIKDKSSLAFSNKVSFYWRGRRRINISTTNCALEMLFFLYHHYNNTTATTTTTGTTLWEFLLLFLAALAMPIILSYTHYNGHLSNNVTKHHCDYHNLLYAFIRVWFRKRRFRRFYICCRSAVGPGWFIRGRCKRNSSSW